MTAVSAATPARATKPTPVATDQLLIICEQLPVVAQKGTQPLFQRATLTAELLKKFVDFRRAYNEDGMSIEEFDAFLDTLSLSQPVPFEDAEQAE